MTAAEYAKQAMEAKLKKLSKDRVLEEGASGKKGLTNEDKEARKAFFEAASTNDPTAWAKSNDIQAKQYDEKGIEWREAAELKTKAQTVGTANQGGNLVPVTLRNAIIEKMYYISPIRQIATVIPDMPAALDMPSDNALPTVYWVGEGSAITESGATFDKKQLVPHKLAGLDSFTSESLADTAVNPALQSLVEDRFATALALEENNAFTSGDGSSKPYGFRSSDITPTAVTGNTTAGNLAYTDVQNLFFGLKNAYRRVAVWVTTSKGVQLLDALKDSTGRPIFMPSFNGQANTELLTGSLFNRPLYIVDEIPTNLGTGTNETELWFGVFKNYWVGDRGAMRQDYGTNGTDFAQDKISLRVIERVAGRPFLDEAFAKMNIK